MKAHIVRDPRCALLWRFDADSAGYAGVERAARLCGVTLRTVGNAELGTPVGNLCAGKPPVAAAPLDTVPELPALIVSGLSHQTGELGRFIDLVRESGADLPLRAMVTPTSKTWTLAALLQELNREHEAVAGGSEKA
ncbi:DUF3783 domain-containing protein [uncultured Subdoligranulum sp.]|uniref:DUF3783 domain-containing protein n=1 Tax=uncultured Subdoligranulum sp. TaxID=512298 RepID=UPI0025CB824F|nr:DUF3783 domain-containing protein [uncultured Subdoligranulum sp.]